MKEFRPPDWDETYKVRGFATEDGTPAPFSTRDNTVFEWGASAMLKALRDKAPIRESLPTDNPTKKWRAITGVPREYVGRKGTWLFIPDDDTEGSVSI